MLRIAVGSVVHEANTFSPRIVDWDEVRGAHPFLADDEVISRAGSLETAIEGFLAVEGEIEWVPLISSALPGGAGCLSLEAFEGLREALVSRIRGAGPLDACLLSIGGGMVVDHPGLEDADGHMLAAIREALPDGCRLGVALDMHANLTPLMVDAADVMLAYQTFPPHWDKREIGTTIARLVLAAARGEINPVTALATAPMLLQPESQDTLSSPMKDVLADAAAASAEPGVLAVSMVAGFGWCDVVEAGTSVLAITDGDRDLAERVASDLAVRWFERRDDFRFPHVSIADAIEQAVAHDDPKPLLLCDHSDNVGAGGAGDATELLAALLRRGATGVAYATICDPEAVALCVDAGIGAEVGLKLGGKRDPIHPRPLELRGLVKSVSDGRYRNTGRLWTDKQGDLGRCVVLGVDGIDVIVSERPTGAADPGVLTSNGLEPSQYSTIVIKSQIFGPKSYGDLAARHVVVAGQGLASSDFTNFTYRRLRRPIFPLDPDVSFDRPAPVAV
jgi:microcystin degradation protein MlrC